MPESNAELSSNNVGRDASKHQGDSLAKAKRTIQYMIDPRTGPQPGHLRTRAILRSLRYITIFVFLRLVRYAKYAVIGALTAAVSGTAVGSIVSGAAFLVAPTGILGGAGVGLLWAIGRFGWRRARARMQRGGQDETADPRKDEREDAGDLYGQNIRRQVTKIGSMVSVFGSSTVTPVAKLWLKSVGSASNAKYPQ